MAGGQQIDSGQGTLVPQGSGATEAVTGSASTLSAGSTVHARLTPLRSRKSSTSSASRGLVGALLSASPGTVLNQVGPALAGSALTGSLGSFGGPRSINLTGSNLPVGAGTMVGSGGSGATQTVTTLTLTHSATPAVAKPFTVGQVFKKGDVPSGDSISLSCAAYQADVRNRWSDGSVRFAVLSGIAVQGDVTISKNGVASTATVNVTEPSITASVAFTSVVDATPAAVAGGSFTASLSTPLASAAWDRTVAHKVREILGPVMSEFHYFVPTADAHTHVWFYVRAYSTGVQEVETVVENGWFNVASPGRRNYNVVVTVGGTARYTGANIAQYHHTRWSRVDWVGTDPAVVPKHNVAYLQSTRLFPKLAVTTLTTAYTAEPDAGTKYASYTKALAEQPTPFSLANIDPSMGSGGISDNVNLFAPWEMTYLVEGNAGAYWSMQANARASGHFSIHYRDESTGGPARAATGARLAWGFNDTGVGIANNSGNADNVTPAPAGSYATQWYATHSPSTAYGAYLTSGRWTALEELQFTAAVSDFESSTSWTYSGYKLIRHSVTLRGWAWYFRFAAQSAICTPDYLRDSAVTGESALQATLALGRLNASVDYYKKTYVDGTSLTPSNTLPRGLASNVFGVLWTPDYTNGDIDLNMWLGGMLQTYGATAAMWPYTTGVFTGSDYAALAAQCARYPLGMLGAASGSTLWDWRFHTFYSMSFGSITRDGSNNQATTIPRTSWDDQWTALNAVTWVTKPQDVPASNVLYSMSDMENFFRTSTAATLAIRTPTIFDATVSSEVVAFPAALAMAHEVAQLTTVSADAATAASRYYGSDTWTNTVSSAFPTDASYAYQSRDYSEVPYTLPTSGQAVAISSNTAITLNGGLPSGWTTTAMSWTLFDSYGGGVFVPNYSQHGAYVFAGTGGHNHADLFDAVVFDFTTGEWSRLINANGVAHKTVNPYAFAVGETGGSPYYDMAGAVPIPPHAYATMAYMPDGAKGSIIHVTRSAAGIVPVNVTSSHRFDLDTRTWSRATTSLVQNAPTIVTEESDAVWDETNNRWWFCPRDINNLDRMYYLDRADMTWKSLSSGGYYPGALVTSGSRVMLQDGRYLIKNNQSQGLWVFDIQTPTNGWQKVTVQSGDASLPGIRNRWARYSNGNWYAFDADVSSTSLKRIRLLSGTPQSGTWTVDSISVTVTNGAGTLPARNSYPYTGGTATTNHYTRLIYVEALDCLAWIPGGNQAVYLIKPGS